MIFYRYEIPDYWLWEDHGYIKYKGLLAQIQDYFKGHVERNHMEIIMDEFERDLISKNKILKILENDINLQKNYRFVFTESGQKRFNSAISALRKFCIENRIGFKIIICETDDITDGMMIYSDEYQALIDMRKFDIKTFHI